MLQRLITALHYRKQILQEAWLAQLSEYSGKVVLNSFSSALWTGRVYLVTRMHRISYYQFHTPLGYVLEHA